ncbi:nucleotidyl cyclase domain-containing protein [Bdellovibrio reynosensis]|uniref:Guanylate cyclase domain-containing protein n=1 Tax=Bdellovibrio reynosensis TaxID=2835041 RepID=A0ABY4C777_9BACT|nr:hypothetical protein [Bdellovibrio reynosensis]UOF00831.1 hypothetical protein MNR06_14110 [Bdellovibrio reynosensis]
MMIKKALKVILIVILLFWPPTFFYLAYYTHRANQQTNEKSGNDISFTEKHTVSLLKNEMYREACSFLKRAYDRNEVTIYGIESESVQCYMPEDVDIAAYPIHEEGKIHTIRISTGTLAYKKQTIGQAKLLLAQTVGSKLSYFELFRQNPFELSMGLLVDTLIAAWLVIAMWAIFVLRNIEHMRQLYRRTHKVPFWYKPINRLAAILEIEQEANITSIQQASARELSYLRSELVYYADTLEYALLEELKLKHDVTFPFSFKGTVARVDINEYGSYNYEGNDAYLLKVKKTFAWLSAECAYRYGGLFEERVGDMVVYVFLGSDAEMRAAAFVRDFSAEFSALKFEFLNHRDVTLHVKSSIVTSPIEMDVAPSKYDYSGPALYLSDRMLGNIDEQEKKKNILVMLPEEFSEVSSIAKQPYLERSVSRKEATLTVCYINSFYDFNDNISLGTYHLGEEGISQQLNFLLKDAEDSVTKIKVAENLLKNLRVKRVSPGISEKWLHTTLSLLRTKASDPNVVATAISLGKTLVPKNNWKPEYSAELLANSDAMDGRMMANSVELFAKWNDFESAQVLNQKVEDDPDPYRTKGNYILAAGLNGLSESIFDQIIEMIKSDDDRLKDSGIYAGAMLIILYREKDYTAIVTYNGYHRLLKVLNETSIKSARLNQLASIVREEK